MIPNRGRARVAGDHDRAPLVAWEMCAAKAGGSSAPATGWMHVEAPTTAAAALRSAGLFHLDGPARRFDAEDFWWRARFAMSPIEAGEEIALCFDGLATIADVWLDGAHVLTSDNMFLAHEIPVTRGAEHEVSIRCRALDDVLATRRPRPAWRAPMVEQQGLRWIRTTLLGRTPGWSPLAAAVGPYRDVRIERRRGVVIDDVRVCASIDGDAGIVDVACRVRATTGEIDRAVVEIVVTRAGVESRATLASIAEGSAHAGRVVVPNVARWWPHTYGEPACYEAHLAIMHEGRTTRIDLGPIGFRTITLDTERGAFAISINDARIFCRGACFTPLDPIALTATRDAYDAAITQVTAAGMNMIRIAGPMIYEPEDLHDACDRRGVMVWQDLMFANMDYPDDAAFIASVSAEVEPQLGRLAGRPSTTIICGSSEGEQQAAMWGAHRARWTPRLFHEVIPRIVERVCKGVPYWPSSAHGGAFPHAANEGSCSYYGVGAYLRPLDDARRAEVRFASECLAFANIPASRALAKMPGGAAPAKVHHPAWKARTPRDLGAGWDFDDVRDHYVERLYRVDPTALRHADHDRYLALGRAATGEVMASVFAEWRRARSTCAGGIVWFLRDLAPGAGWGIVDATGAPKAAWYFLRRVLAKVAIAITDEGVNGLAIHAWNDGPASIACALDLALFRAGEISVGRATHAIDLPARAALEIAATSLLDGFVDLSYAYRFGPSPCDLVVATLRTEGGDVIGEAFHFPLGLPSSRELDIGLTATASPAEGGFDLTVRTRRFAQSVSIEADGLVPDDDFFHLPPSGTRTVRLRGRGPLRGVVQALNVETSARIAVTS